MNSYLSILFILISCLLEFSQSCKTDGDCSNGQVCARKGNWRLKKECKDRIIVKENEGCFREYKCADGLLCKKDGRRSTCKAPIVGALKVGNVCENTSECEKGSKCLQDDPVSSSIFNLRRKTCKSDEKESVPSKVTELTGLTDYSDI